MRFITSSLVAATLLASIAGANAQGREELNSGIHGATKQQSQTYSRDRAENFRDAYASGHTNHNHNVRQKAPVNPTLENFHGGPAR